MNYKVWVGAGTLFFLMLGLFILKTFSGPRGEEIKPYSTKKGRSGAHQMDMGTVGDVSNDDFDPTAFSTAWNFNDLPPDKRNKYYRESELPNGQKLREYWFYAVDKEIEIAPGIIFPAWTFNGQVPGPTMRATEGDRIRIYFLNQGTRPHTMHFHGFHPATMDGAAPDQFVAPGDSFVYEFDAEPFGVHLYHCHTTPLTQHIAKGLYGMYIIDPKAGRLPAKELIMVMNGFDTNFDQENEIYAVNTVAFHYANHPIPVQVGELVRIYVVNILEFDQINSFHIHGHFFQEFRTGTVLTPNAYTDTVVFGQGERSILELRFRYPGLFMFHAHKTEFAEKGWMGLFDVK